MFCNFSKEMVFPSIMVLLSIGSAVSYGYKGELRMTLYWIFAAGLTGSLTFIK